MVIAHETSLPHRLVALLAEGVDRNVTRFQRNWDHLRVALLAEGVDRNTMTREHPMYEMLSPSSRRAWIEITTQAGLLHVADCRPPRGGRG